MLFKLLLFYRPRGYTAKEVFMEHLWPEGDPEKTAKSFHVAMAALRKILEPEMSRKAGSSYIISDGDSYHLDLGSAGQCDVEIFIELCRKAGQEKDPEQAISLLLRARDLYHGDFLEEDAYEAWCAEERDRLKGLYLSVLASIADYHEWKNDHDRSISACSEYLAHDPYAEDIYQRLMRYYALQGNNAMVKKVFERCRETIENGLGCPLSRDTLILLDELMAQA
jgi:two-component SAPR family response regulator